MNVLSQGEIEAAIMSLSDSLEDLTTEYTTRSDAAAEAETDYRLAYYRAIIATKASGVNLPDSDGVLVHHSRPSEKLCEAIAVADSADLFRAYKVTAAAADSIKQAIYTRRERLNALRTLAANVRSLTTS